MIEILSKEFSNIQVQYTKRDKFMPKRGTLSTSKAKRMIGYRSNWPLHKGYREYIKWYKNLYYNRKSD